MRLVRFTSADGGPVSYGAVEGGGDDAVVDPSKVLAFGRNYAGHAKGMGNEVREIPIAF